MEACHDYVSVVPALPAESSHRILDASRKAKPRVHIICLIKVGVRVRVRPGAAPPAVPAVSAACTWQTGMWIF